MASLLLIVLLSLVLLIWVKGTRTRREQWLARLALPGVWVCELPDGDSTRIELKGSLIEGEYTEHEGGDILHGNWRLESHTLTLGRAAGGLPIDIALFGEGKMRMSRPDGTQRAYVKQRDSSNVVPLSSKR